MRNLFCKNCKLLILFTIFLASCVSNASKKQTLFRIQNNGLYGFINKQGEVIIEPQYKYVSPFSKDDVALVINELKLNSDSSIFVNYGFIDKQNQRINEGNTMKIEKTVVSFWEYKNIYDLVEKYNCGSLDFRSRVLPQLEFRDGLYLYQDLKLPEKIRIGDEKVELPSIKIGGDLFGYKDINNNVIIDAQYDVGREFHNGVAVIRMSTYEALANNYYLDTIYLRGLNVWGAINTSGERVVDFEYFYIQDYLDDGTTWAMTLSMDKDNPIEQIRKEWVSINKNGEIIAGPLQYNIAWIYNNDTSPIIAFDLGFLGVFYSFIDKNGIFLTDFDNDGALNLPLSEEGGMSEMFKDVTRFSDGIAGIFGVYMNNPGWYFVDKDFSVLSSAYDSIHSFSENLAAVQELRRFQGKWGFVKKDSSSNAVIQTIPFIFSECGDFYNGLAYFSNHGNAFDVEGYINHEGVVVWQTKRNKR